MGKWSVRQFLSNRQQQSFVISLGAFCASLLLVALVCVLALIALRGSDYFWPRQRQRHAALSAHLRTCVA